jgi:hypothetical protein
MTERAILGVLAASLATGTLGSCSRGDFDAPEATTQTAFHAIPITPSHQRSVCNMMPAKEMSRLLGGAVTAQPPGLPGTCTYSPAPGVGPYAELRIEPGDGAAAMAGAGFVAGKEPGVVDPLAGLGDEAIGVGPPS